MKPSIPHLLSFNGGYVDTAGFLTLQGLFTAHVTGNFVTLGAALALGTSGALAKILALPVFCAVVVLVGVMSYRLTILSLPPLRSALFLKAVLLAVGGGLANLWGPFQDGDGWRAIVTGMVLVAAMAIQNAVHRIHMSKSPPTTLMTGSSTLIMLDAADLMTGRLPADAHPAVRARFVSLAASIGAFALGCAVAAVTFVVAGMSVFILPPLIAFATALAAPKSNEPVPA